MSNYQSGFTGAQIDAAVGGAVRFDIEQTKTNAEKAQAQKNIGMESVVADIAKKIDKATQKTYYGTIVAGKWQQSNGAEYASSYGYYLSASVIAGKKYYVGGVIINASYPLIVMFDESDNVIGTEGTSGNYTVVNDYEFVPPAECVKVSINARKIPSSSNSLYPYIYSIENTEQSGNSIDSSLAGKQSKALKWETASYELNIDKFVKIGSSSASYKIVEDSSGVAGGYSYIKLPYDRTKQYRFYAQCRMSVAPAIICADDNLEVIKTFDSTEGTIVKAKTYEIPENTNYIYVNGYTLQMMPLVEVATERNLASFEGGKIGVFFGDSITQGNNVYITPDVTPFMDYPSIVGKSLDCTVYNGGLGGGTFSFDRSIDFENVADCIVSGDFSSVIAGITQYSLNASAIEQYNAIAALDFETVDFIAIAFGTNDWNFGATANSVKTAMAYCINKILTKYPHLKIYVFTPIYRYNINNSGEDSDTYVNTSSELKLHDICEAIIEEANANHIPCLDLYYNCNINKYNKSLYMGDDTHPNATGYELLGSKVAKFINAN